MKYSSEGSTSPVLRQGTSLNFYHTNFLKLLAWHLWVAKTTLAPFQRPFAPEKEQALHLMNWSPCLPEGNGLQKSSGRSCVARGFQLTREALEPVGWGGFAAPLWHRPPALTRAIYKQEVCGGEGGA